MEDQTTERTLSQGERDLVKGYIADYLSVREAGPEDRRFFPVNEQIAEEELTLLNVDYRLNEEAIRLASENSGIGNLVNFADLEEIKKKRGLIAIRKEELARAWYREDKAGREASGARWEDLNTVLAMFDINPIDPEFLRRPHLKKLFSREEDPESRLASSHIFVSRGDKEVTRMGQPRLVPSHVVEIFGNEVDFEEEDFDRVVAELSLEYGLVFQICGSQRSSTTGTNWMQYRLAVHYKNWIFSKRIYTEILDEDYNLPFYPNDPTRRYDYWEDSLLPERLVSKPTDIYAPPIILPTYLFDDSLDEPEPQDS